MSTDYQNSILWRGEDPLKKKFKPSYDHTVKTTRYFPGKRPAWAREEKQEEEKPQEEVPRRRRRDRTAAAVISEDPGAARLRRLQASATSGDTGAERLLRHRVVHDAQVLEASHEDKAEDDDLKDKLEDKLEDQLEKKEDFEGVQDVKELKDEEDLDIDAERKPVKAEVKSEVKAEVKAEEDDEDLVAARRERMRELALLRRREEEDLLQKEELQEDDIEDEDESEYESDSGEDDPRQKAMLKPVFVSKAQRDTLKEKDEMEKKAEVAEELRQQQISDRKVESKSLVIDEIKKDSEAELAKQTGINEDDASDIELIDDNDEINEAEEYELWKIRELKRIKRDKEAAMTRQKEIEFVERRRQMTDEERAADDARLDDGHKFKDEAKKFNFMQKYYHRGTFFQDKATSGDEPLYLRDYHEPTAEETFDKSMLPKTMQVRRGLFGKKGQVKHTHLTDVDTTDMSAAWSQHSKQVQKYQERMASASGVNNFARPNQNKSASS